MLHRPGRELENLMPEYLEQLLFDDIPYLKAAQSEHDAFAACLREQGVEVLYLTDLVVETIAQDGIRRELTEQSWTRRGSPTTGPETSFGIISRPWTTGRWWIP